MADTPGDTDSPRYRHTAVSEHTPCTPSSLNRMRRLVPFPWSLMRQVRKHSVTVNAGLVSDGRRQGGFCVLCAQSRYFRSVNGCPSGGSGQRKLQQLWR